jgi:HEAT repeat protein
MNRNLLSLLAVVGLFAPAGARAEDNTEVDKRVLRKAGISSEPADLMAWLKVRTKGRLETHRIEELVARLGSDRFRVRVEAAGELVAAGPQVLSRLRKATTEGDLETRRRASECIRQIEQSSRVAVAGAVIRSLARQRPRGATSSLLDYLPFAPDAETEEAVWYALAALSKDAQSDPALKNALTDPEAARRAAAAFLLGWRGDGSQRTAARTCLVDRDLHVRLRAAQGLLAAGERETIPVLIALLETAPLELAWQAEELLCWVAGMGAPETTVGAGTAERRKACRNAWERWRREQGAKVDLSGWEKWPRRPGLLLVSETVVPQTIEPNGQRRHGAPVNHLSLIGCDGPPRWRWNDVPLYSDVWYLPGGRLLLTEKSAERICERDLSGNLLHRVRIPPRMEPDVCRPLPNGNRFVASSHALEERTPDGELVSRYHDLPQRKGTPQLLPHTARCLADGCVLGVSEDGYVLELEPATGALKNLAKLKGGWSVRQVVVLESGRFLLQPDVRDCRREMNRAGEVVKPFEFLYLTDAVSLPNGNTVAGWSYDNRGRLYEVDAAGKIVWEVFCEGKPRLIRPLLNLVRLGFDAPRPRGAEVDLVASRADFLRRPYSPARATAAEALMELGPRARGALPVLVEALGDPNPSVRMWSSNAVSAVGPDALPAVLPSLRSSRAAVRTAAAWVFGEIDRAAQAASPELLALLDDPDAAVREAVARALSRRDAEGEAIVKGLCQRLDDPVWNVRSWALSGLGHAASRSPVALQTLLEATRAKDRFTRCGAVYELGHIPARDERIVKALVTALRDEEIDVRTNALISLKLLREKARSAVPALLEAFKAEGLKPNVRRLVRQMVLEALAAIGGEAREVLPLALRTLEDEPVDTGTREAACRLIAGLGRAGREAIPVLRRVARKNQWPRPNPALETLARFGEEGVAILLEEAKQIGSDQSLKKYLLLVALGHSGPSAKAAVPELLKLLERADDMFIGWEPYGGPLAALGAIGPEARAAVPRLLELARNRENPNSFAAMRALARIAPNDAAVRTLITGVAEDRSQPVSRRADALHALAEFGAHGGLAIPALLKILRQPAVAAVRPPTDPRRAFLSLASSLHHDDQQEPNDLDVTSFDLRVRVCTALVALHAADRETVRTLTGLLEDREAVRLAAVWALGKSGPAAAPAIPDLIALLKNHDLPLELQVGAVTALSRIGRATEPAVLGLLKSKRFADRWRALELLLALGPPSRETRPALQEVADGSDVLLARLARHVLGAVHDRERPGR